MNELELKNIWQITNEKLEQSMELNKVNSDEISKMKVYHFISSMRPIKIFSFFTGIIWVGSGAIILGRLYLYAYAEASKFFLFSASIQVVLTAIALFIYLYQLITIFQVDLAEPVLKTQAKLAGLKATTLWVTRILVLQLPVWTTFWWNETMFRDWSILQWITSLFVTVLFSVIAIWLFFSIKYKNRNKKWFQLIFRGKEWGALINAFELLEQVGEYKSKSSDK